MHFLGMLAFELCAAVRYDLGITLLSMLPSLAASWVALSLLARRDLSLTQLCVGGVLVGAGIGAMHYSGMAAMQMAPLLRYDPWMFALSIIVAVALAILALWVRFGLEGRLPTTWALLLSALVMGLAISGMHYTGMAAARFVGTPESQVPVSYTHLDGRRAHRRPQGSDELRPDPVGYLHPPGNRMGRQDRAAAEGRRHCRQCRYLPVRCQRPRHEMCIRDSPGSSPDQRRTTR